MYVCVCVYIYICIYIKVKFTAGQATKAQRGADIYISTPSWTSALDGVGGQRHTPAALNRGKTRYTLHRRLGGYEKSRLPPGFDTRTVQLVAYIYIYICVPYIYILFYYYYYFIFQLRTAAFKAYCSIWVRRPNFRHQASPHMSPRESTQRRKVELWARNVR